MTRKKVELAFISNDSSRKTTFKKRKKGLMKKVNELSTLCGIAACVIINSPYDSNPQVWPSNSSVHQIISEFRALPEMDQRKKMVNQESFLQQKIMKASEKLKRQIKENRELEMTEVMFQCLLGNMGMFHMNILDLNDLGYLIDQYLKTINHRIEMLQNSGIEIGESSNALVIASEGAETMAYVPATTDSSAPTTELGSSSSFFNQIQQQPFRHSATPPAGFYEHPQNLNQNQNNNQQHWFTDMMNYPEQMSYTAEQTDLPFMDDNNHNQDQPQRQQILGESSTIPVSSSSVTSVTNPNFTNTMWFR